MVAIRTFFAFILFIPVAESAYAQFITNHSALPMPDFSKPATGIVFSDPQFSAPLVRLSDARSSGLPGIFPDYSKRQAWNSDETLLLLRTASGEVLIYNGVTYQYIKTLPGNVAGIQDIFWHPSNQDIVYFVAENTINTMDVQSEQITLLHAFGNYAYVTTRGEGNMSNDAHYIALAGYDSNWLLTDFFVYDLIANSVIGSVNAGGYNQNFDWISISPLGNFVVVDYADDINGAFHGVEVYDRQFNVIWQKPLGYGHSDLGLDSNGSEVLIMDFYDADSNFTYIKKFDLATGNETNLLSVSALFDLHESCRSMNRPGWVYISTFDYVGRLTDDSASWLPFEDEVFALKMDGTGSVQRLAHHHSRRYSPSTPNSDSSVYFSEPHATVNRNGTRILFGSNWRENMEQDTSIDAYIIDISNLLTTSFETGTYRQPYSMKIFPNPFLTSAAIMLPEEKIFPANYQLVVQDVFGKIIEEVKPASSGFVLPRSGLSEGIYFIKLYSGEKIIGRGKISVE